MTTTKPLPPHGTTARAKGRPTTGIKGCGCRPCRDAENHYDKRRRYLNATGRTYMVDATPAAQHLEKLFAAGAGWVLTAAAADTSSSVIWAVLNGKKSQITRGVSTRILAVKAADVQPAGRSVSAVGSIRRVRALIAIGHRCLDVTAASGLDASVIRKIVNGHPATVTAATAQKIDNAYQALATSPGTSTRSLNRGRKEQGPTPDYWDDWGGIDDPDFQPTPEVPRYVQLAEDTAWLEEQGFTRAQAAHRLGVTKNYLEKSVARHQAATAGQEAAA